MFRSERYLDFVRSHDCCSCLALAPSDAHHCAPDDISPQYHGGGGAMKKGDMWTIPLCRKCHMRWHDSNTYRELGHRTVLESDHLMAREQLRLMSRWILMVDPESGLF